MRFLLARSCHNGDGILALDAARLAFSEALRGDRRGRFVYVCEGGSLQRSLAGQRDDKGLAHL